MSLIIIIIIIIIIILFIFQDFEVIISSNVKYNCQTRMRRMTMNEQSTNNGLIYETYSQVLFF